MSLTANLFLAAAKNIANTRGSIPTYTFHDRDVIMRFEKPKDTDEKVFDRENTYHDSHVFVEGYCNPLYIDLGDIKNGNIELYPSERYKMAMQNDSIKDSMFAKELQWNKIMKVGTIVLGAVVMLQFVVIAMVA